MLNEKQLAEDLARRYGPVIDLKANPGIMLDIVRQISSRFNSDIPGTPDGGGPPTGPTNRPGMVSNEDLMKAILKLTRDVDALGKSRGQTTAKEATSKRK